MNKKLVFHTIIGARNDSFGIESNTSNKFFMSFENS